MGIEVELQVKVLKYDKIKSTFASLEEKTNNAKIFETRGESPEFPELSIINVTADNATSLGKQRAAEIAGLINTNLKTNLNVEFADDIQNALSIIEISTGPLPFDKVLHHNVRSAVNLLIKVIYDECGKNNGYAHYQDVKNEYNNRLAQLIKKETFGKTSKERLDWHALLLLYSKAVEYSPFCDIYFIVDRSYISGQATFSIPFDNINSVEHKSIRLREAVEDKGIFLNATTENRMIDLKFQKMVNSLLQLWAITTRCATLSKNIEACKANQYKKCILTCNKNWASPTPHVDICELYNKLYSAFDEFGTMDELSVKKALQKLADENQMFGDKIYDKNEDGISILLSPFNKDPSICKSHWEHGYYNNDATKIDVLDLKTKNGIKIGVAIEDRSKPFGNPNLVLKSPLDKGNKEVIDYFNYWRDIAESNDIKCTIDSEIRSTGYPVRSFFRCR